jgi:hypothetical protein
MKQRAISAKKEQLEKIKAEIDSISWLVDHTKMCPKCKIPIEKTEGCMFFTIFPHPLLVCLFVFAFYLLAVVKL